MRHLIFAAFASLSVPQASAEGRTFAVENNSDQRIVSIEVSEDGESGGPFEIDRGIPSGETMQLVWDESTDGSDCEWPFRATFEGGCTAGSAWIDFWATDALNEIDFD